LYIVCFKINKRINPIITHLVYLATRNIVAFINLLFYTDKNIKKKKKTYLTDKTSSWKQGQWIVLLANVSVIIGLHIHTLTELIFAFTIL